MYYGVLFMIKFVFFKFSFISCFISLFEYLYNIIIEVYLGRSDHQSVEKIK